MSFRSSRNDNLEYNSSNRDGYDDNNRRIGASRVSSTRKMQLDLDASSEDSDNGRNNRYQSRASQSKTLNRQRNRAADDDLEDSRDRDHDFSKNTPKYEEPVVRVVPRNRSSRVPNHGDNGSSTANSTSGLSNNNMGSFSGFVPRDLRNSNQNSLRNSRESRRSDQDSYYSHQSNNNNNSSYNGTVNAQDEEEDPAHLPWNKTPKRFLAEDEPTPNQRSSSNNNNVRRSREIEKSDTSRNPGEGSSNNRSSQSQRESSSIDKEFKKLAMSATTTAKMVRKAVEADFEIEEDEEESETSFIMEKRNTRNSSSFSQQRNNASTGNNNNREEDDESFHYSPKSKGHLSNNYFSNKSDVDDSTNHSQQTSSSSQQQQSQPKPLPKSPPKKSRRPLPQQQYHYQPMTNSMRNGSWVGNSTSERGAMGRARAHDAGAQALEDAENDENDDGQVNEEDRGEDQNESYPATQKKVDFEDTEESPNTDIIQTNNSYKGNNNTTPTTTSNTGSSSGLSIATPHFNPNSYSSGGLSPYTPTHLISSQTGYIVNPENPRASFVLISYPKGWRAPMVQCTIIRDRKSLHGKLYPTYEMILEEPRKTIIIAQKMSLNRTSNYHFFDMTRGVVSTKLSKKAGNYLGKLRAKNTNRTAYTLLNHNQDKEEVAAVLFERPSLMDTWMDGNQPRKMKVLLPMLDSDSMPLPSKVDDPAHGGDISGINSPNYNSNNNISNAGPNSGGRMRSPSFGSTFYSNLTSNNTNNNSNSSNNNNNKEDNSSEKETGSSSMIRILEDVEDTKRPLPHQYRVFQTKEPTFVNGNYRLNFHGRVTVPSVKNFQIVSEFDVDEVVCQFGKVDNNVFHLDYKAPLNAFQAFALALCQFNL